MEKEIWKDVVGYEDLYRVSNYGQVWSNRRQRLLKQEKNRLGYMIVFLSSNNKRKAFCVHRLVAIAFIPNPNSYREINHKDENKGNNYVDNLEWCTRTYNVNYGTGRQRAGIHISESMRGRTIPMEVRQKIADKVRGNTNRRKKLHMYDYDGNYIKSFATTYDAMYETGINRCNISACCNGRLRHAGKYMCRYETTTKKGL